MADPAMKRSVPHTVSLEPRQWGALNYLIFLPLPDKYYLLKFQPQTGEGSTLDYSYLQSGQDGYSQYAQVSSTDVL